MFPYSSERREFRGNILQYVTREILADPHSINYSRELNRETLFVVVDDERGV